MAKASTLTFTFFVLLLFVTSGWCSRAEKEEVGGGITIDTFCKVDQDCGPFCSALLKGCPTCISGLCICKCKSSNPSFPHNNNP